MRIKQWPTPRSSEAGLPWLEVYSAISGELFPAFVLRVERVRPAKQGACLYTQCARATDMGGHCAGAFAPGLDL